MSKAQIVEKAGASICPLVDHVVSKRPAMLRKNVMPEVDQLFRCMVDKYSY